MSSCAFGSIAIVYSYGQLSLQKQDQTYENLQYYSSVVFAFYSELLKSLQTCTVTCFRSYTPVPIKMYYIFLQSKFALSPVPKFYKSPTQRSTCLRIFLLKSKHEELRERLYIKSHHLNFLFFPLSWVHFLIQRLLSFYLPNVQTLTLSICFHYT